MNVFVAPFIVRTSAGPISVPGLRVGDKIIWQDINILPIGEIETTISFDNQLQQLVGESPNPTSVLIVRNPDALP